MQQFGVGVDLGGSSLKYGICRNDGKIIKTFWTAMDAALPSDKILSALAKAAKTAIRYAQKKDLTVGAVGIGTPGCVDSLRGFLIGNTPNFKNWEEVEIKTFLQKELDKPVAVDNDANMMAYGEASFGAGKNFRHLVCVTLGTGIGGGIIIDGRLFSGSGFCGSEVGHMSIVADGEPCGCGNRGCWERYAATGALVRYYNSLNPLEIADNAQQIFEVFAEGDHLARLAIERTVKYVAVGLVNLVNIFNPQAIIVGGGISEAGGDFLDRIHRLVKKSAIQSAVKDLAIVPAKLGNNAGWLGAAASGLKQMAK